MWFRNEEDSLWGYKEQGKEKLQSVQSFHLTKKHNGVMLRPAEKLKWSNKNKTV